MSVGLDACKLLITNVKTGDGNAQHTRRVRMNVLYAIDFKDGERGRNRTYNLLIKSSTGTRNQLLRPNVTDYY
jgi:hypothetical protein